MAHVPETHPRYESLRLRDAIVDGIEHGITSVHGLIAHGRGEAFDYLLGERTHDFANKAIHAAVAMLTTAKEPVLSVNGNAAALVADELVDLANYLRCPLEINLFHKSKKRERAIKKSLIASGAKEVLLPSSNVCLEGIDSNRGYVHSQGIYKADVVFVPLEDGDRSQALRTAGKEVITIDLNPLSRTASLASISIVDNVVRALPLLTKFARDVTDADSSRRILKEYDNHVILQAAEQQIRKRKT